MRGEPNGAGNDGLATGTAAASRLAKYACACILVPMLLWLIAVLALSVIDYVFCFLSSTFGLIAVLSVCGGTVGICVAAFYARKLWVAGYTQVGSHWMPAQFITGAELMFYLQAFGADVALTVVLFKMNVPWAGLLSLALLLVPAVLSAAVLEGGVTCSRHFSVAVIGQLLHIDFVREELEDMYSMMLKDCTHGRHRKFTLVAIQVLRFGTEALGQLLLKMCMLVLGVFTHPAADQVQRAKPDKFWRSFGCGKRLEAQLYQPPLVALYASSFTSFLGLAATLAAVDMYPEDVFLQKCRFILYTLSRAGEIGSRVAIVAIFTGLAASSECQALGWLGDGRLRGTLVIAGLLAAEFFFLTLLARALVPSSELALLWAFLFLLWTPPRAFVRFRHCRGPVVMWRCVQSILVAGLGVYLSSCSTSEDPQILQRSKLAWQHIQVLDRGVLLLGATMVPLFVITQVVQGAVYLLQWFRACQFSETYASMSGQLEAEDKTTAVLHRAVQEGVHCTEVRLLLQAFGSDEDGETSVVDTVVDRLGLHNKEPADVLELLLAFGFRGSEDALDSAVKHRRKDVMKLLISHGHRSSSSQGLKRGVTFSALHEAARRCDPEMLSMLLDAGADVNTLDGNGQTAAEVVMAQRGTPELQISDVKATGVEHQKTLAHKRHLRAAFRLDGNRGITARTAWALALPDEPNSKQSPRVQSFRWLDFDQRIASLSEPVDWSLSCYLEDGFAISGTPRKPASTDVKTRMASIDLARLRHMPMVDATSSKAEEISVDVGLGTLTFKATLVFKPLANLRAYKESLRLLADAAAGPLPLQMPSSRTRDEVEASSSGVDNTTVEQVGPLMSSSNPSYTPLAAGGRVIVII